VKRAGAAAASPRARASSVRWTVSSRNPEASSRSNAERATVAPRSSDASRESRKATLRNPGHPIASIKPRAVQCGSNGYISYTSVYTWPSNLFAGVSYAGDSKNSVYGVGWNVWKEHLSGHFTAIATPWITVYNYYPWMEFYVGGGGQTYYEHYGA
jgi:hypothetical protein